MSDWILFTIRDFHRGVSELQPSDLAQPVGVLLWLIILAVPLRDVDRRDINGFLVYCLCSLATGVTLCFALTEEFTPQLTASTLVSTSLVFVLFAALRWLFVGEGRLNEYTDVVVTKTAQKPQENPYEQGQE